MHVPHICVTRPQVLFYTLLGVRVEPWALIFILIPDQNLFALSTSSRRGATIQVWQCFRSVTSHRFLLVWASTHMMMVMASYS